MTKPRPKYTTIDEVLAESARQEWRIERGRRYYMIKCPCPDMHHKTVHLTPSDANYGRKLVGQLRRAKCWEDSQ
jgi:hypothetical protein